MKKQALKTGAVLFGLGIAMSVQADAQVAALGEVEGTVLVSQGKEYVAAQPGSALQAGSRILTMDKSGVAVVYKDGCTVRMKENSRLVLSGAGDCAFRTAQVKSVGPYYAQAIGGVSDAGAGGGGAGGGFWGGMGGFGVGAAGVFAVGKIYNNMVDASPE